MFSPSIRIEFSRSLSPRFSIALQEARKHPSFVQSGNTYNVTLSREEAYRMAELLKGLRSRRVFVDGKEAPWDEVFHYCGCYALRRLAYDPEEYCLGDSRHAPAINPWGCIQAIMPLSGSAEWLSWGCFDLDGTFIFDKKKIRHYLIANTHRYRFCPALRIDAMLRILEAFPETANPRVNPDWQALAGYGVAPSSPAAVKRICEAILEKTS